MLNKMGFTKAETGPLKAASLIARPNAFGACRVTRPEFSVRHDLLAVSQHALTAVVCLLAPACFWAKLAPRRSARELGGTRLRRSRATLGMPLCLYFASGATNREFSMRRSDGRSKSFAAHFGSGIENLM